jgi:hypothetical protein
LQTTTKLRILRKLFNAYTNLRITKCKQKNLKKWILNFKKAKAQADERKRIELEEAERKRIA